MNIPGRKFSAGTVYRYGFNGKELDNESSVQYDYGFRIYNPRLGKFLSTDPLFKSYPELTPYQFASNCPIEAIDLDGLEARSFKFIKDFTMSALRGVGNAVSYVANNPKHAGYSNGVQPNTGKPPTQAEIKRYDFSITQQFDPHYQIENFSNNLVYGTYNFVGGIIDGDGARTAQAIPPLLGAVGTVVGLSRFTNVSTKVLTKAGKTVNKTFSTASIRTTQTTVNGVEKYVEQFKKAGKYDAEPVDIVKMEDGIYSSVDHARLMAAEQLGLKAEANAHNFNDPIPYKRAREIAGDKVDDANLPKTWGDAIKVRVDGQGKKYATENPNGSFNRPKVKS